MGGCRPRGGQSAPDTPAGTRVAETLAYLEFVEQELPGLLKRWRKRKAELGFT